MFGVVNALRRERDGRGQGERTMFEIQTLVRDSTGPDAAAAGFQRGVSRYPR